MKNEYEIEILVEDNGIGIPQNKLLELQESISKSNIHDLYEGYDIKEKNFGINNVNERIKLYFGQDYGLDIDSIWEEGTKVSIKIPIVR